MVVLCSEPVRSARRCLGGLDRVVLEHIGGQSTVIPVAATEWGPCGTHLGR